jgi:hypothetical protein
LGDKILIVISYEIGFWAVCNAKDSQNKNKIGNISDISGQTKMGVVTKKYKNNFS